MNDRFRFRAWYQPSWEEHRMLYDVEQTYDFMRGYPESVHADNFGEVLEDSNFIVMQCTGLKDKNGKLIYEGDVVKDDHEALHFVTWFYNGFQLEPLFKNGYTIGIVNDEIEVIGNIYENKEILNTNNEVNINDNRN